MRSPVVCLLAVAALAATAFGQTLEKTIWLPDSLSSVIWPAAICYNPVENVMYVGGQAGGCIMVIDAATYEKKARIPVRQGVFALCFDRERNQLYCAGYGRSTQSSITLIDGRSNGIKTQIEVGPNPCAFCIDTILGKLYCAVGGTGAVAVVDCATGLVVANVNVGTVRGLCWNPAMGKVYCANPGGATVSVIDCVSDSVVATVPTPEGPMLVCYNPVQNKVYCTADSVAIIDCAEDTVCGILPERATAFLFNSHQDKLYYLPRWWEEVRVADGAGDSVVAVLPVHGGEVRALAADPSGEKVYCGVRGRLPTGAWVLVVDAGQDSILDSLHFGGHCDGVSGLACGGSDDTLFACTFAGSGWPNGGVVVLDVAGREVLAELTTCRYPRHLAYNSTENLVYVAEPERTRPSVVVVDAASNQVVNTIPALPAEGLEYNSQENKLYVAFRSFLAVFDGTNHELIATLAALSNCDAICYSPSSNKVYVAGVQGLVVADGAGDTVRARLTFEYRVELLQCAPDVNKVFVGDSRWGQSRLYVVDGAGDTVSAVILTGCYQDGLCYNPSAQEVYAVCRNSHGVWVIDAVENNTLATVDARWPLGPICYASQTNTVYCACAYPARLEAIDCATRQVTATIPTPDWVTVLFYNAVNDRLYCISKPAGAVFVVDPATNQIVETIDVGLEPAGAAWSPIQNRVYVANWYNSSLSVIRDSMPAAAGEKGMRAEGRGMNPSIIRSVLHVQPTAHGSQQTAELLDISGRKVMDLHPGENDIRHLAPGVYFVRREGGFKTQRVVIAR